MMKGYNIKDCITNEVIYKKKLVHVAEFLQWRYGSIAYHFQARNGKPAATEKVFRHRGSDKYYLVQKITE